jgi:hypothetical protein
MSLNSGPKSTSSTAAKDDRTTCDSYIFDSDGLILAYPKTYDESATRRNADNDINPIRQFFDSLVKKLF